MQKDVVYLDVDDDITAIIGKVKHAESKIVALVPPKRLGAIQSAVNLKLVHRAAEHAGKHLVVISNNQALVALASSAGILTAKNLQSRPEMAEIPALAVDDGEDVIDGATLPVGDHAKIAEKAGDAPAPVKKDINAAMSALEDEEDATQKLPDTPEPSATGSGARMRDKKAKVPNFTTLRKRIFLIGAGLAVLIAFLVWALVYAPTAKIIITARTSDATLDSKVSLGTALQTDLRAGTIKAEAKTVKKDSSIPFTATGKKDVGDKATGSVKYSNDGLTATTIPAGTQLSAGGFTFITDSAVTVPGPTIGSCGGRACIVNGTANGTVTAAESGSRYNGVTGAASGAGMSATLAGATSGGTDKTVTVVQQSDIDAASGAASKQSDSDAAKKDLSNQFGGNYVVLDASFKTDAGALTASPAVGQEAADGKGTLSGSVTYTLTAVAKSEISKYLDQYFAQQVDGKADQKVYDTGLGGVRLTDTSAIDNGFSASIAATGKIGPKINEQTIKEYARGKKYAEIKSRIETINGVDTVDVQFSPFWVTSAPDDVKRISFEFKVTK